MQNRNVKIWTPGKYFTICSERVGWVPVLDEVPESVRDEYKWVQGLSVTEMEIMHGAYRRDNPNGNN